MPPSMTGAWVVIGWTLPAQSMPSTAVAPCCLAVTRSMCPNRPVESAVIPVGTPGRSAKRLACPFAPIAMTPGRPPGCMAKIVPRGNEQWVPATWSWPATAMYGSGPTAVAYPPGPRAKGVSVPARLMVNRWPSAATANDPPARGPARSTTAATCRNLTQCAGSAGPGADAYLIALGIGEYPERRGKGVVDQPAARGHGGAHPGLGLVVGHRDVEVHPVALRARGVHLLEPHGRQLLGGVHEAGPMAVAARLVHVGQRRLPER